MHKRNQVEEAIAAAMDSANPEDAADLRNRLKRLLDTDFILGGRSAVGAPRLSFAFSSGERPGRGGEVRFSSYEVYALLLGNLLLVHRWPQQTVVRIMRQARSRLEAEHARILSLDPIGLFDEGRLAEQRLPGAAAFDSADPTFLAIFSDSRPGGSDAGTQPHAIEVCVGEVELMNFRRKRSPAGTSMTVLELTAPAFLLADALARTKPKARGRPGR